MNAFIMGFSYTIWAQTRDHPASAFLSAGGISVTHCINFLLSFRSSLCSVWANPLPDCILQSLSFPSFVVPFTKKNYLILIKSKIIVFPFSGPCGVSKTLLHGNVLYCELWLPEYVHLSKLIKLCILMCAFYM